MTLRGAAKPPPLKDDARGTSYLPVILRRERKRASKETAPLRTAHPSRRAKSAHLRMTLRGAAKPPPLKDDALGTSYLPVILRRERKQASKETAPLAAAHPSRRAKSAHLRMTIADCNQSLRHRPSLRNSGATDQAAVPTRTNGNWIDAPRCLVFIWVIILIFALIIFVIG
jgi:hypothetical protein